MLPPFMTVRDGHIELRIKAVPGARREEIAGPLGDRLKVRVSQPPEGGRANDAIRALIAATLGVEPRAVELVSGPTSPQKTLRLIGAASRAEEFAARLE
ncbi:MAG: DUF167 domain-containing protein [Phycisphaerales bacterium]